MDDRHCRGCEDDFYNGRNGLGVAKCWSLGRAKLVTRYRIGTWTTPTSPGAFAEVRVPNCYRQKGQHFYEKAPDFAVQIRRPPREEPSK